MILLDKYWPDWTCWNWFYFITYNAYIHICLNGTFYLFYSDFFISLICINVALLSLFVFLNWHLLLLYNFFVSPDVSFIINLRSFFIKFQLSFTYTLFQVFLRFFIELIPMTTYRSNFHCWKQSIHTNIQFTIIFAVPYVFFNKVSYYLTFRFYLFRKIIVFFFRSNNNIFIAITKCSLSN